MRVVPVALIEHITADGPCAELHVGTLLRSEGSEYQVQLKAGVGLRVGHLRREALERRLGRT